MSKVKEIIMSKDNLGDRMKGYENIERRYLTRRMPMLIRIDGKAFHSFTKGFKRPFDDVLTYAMWEAAIYLCQNIMGAKIAYTQSDEINILLTDYDNLDTQAWFDKNIQKMCSISASMATMAFNQVFCKSTISKIVRGTNSDEIYQRKAGTAMFDSRVYVIPKEEVCNAFIWRQQDATRNAIQMVGQANFSHKELQNKNCNQIQEMLFTEKGVNFNDLPTYQKRGACIVKEEYADRTRWVVDKEIPIFTQDKDYIERYI
jgi:tRNA(His) 5'-end guanylyltransferase